MASVSFSTLHTSIATQVKTVSGYVEALWPLDPARSADSIADKAFAIELQPTVERLDRAQSGKVSLIDTSVRIRYLARVNPATQVSSHTDALDDAVSIIQALMSQTGAWQEGLRVRYTGGPETTSLGGGDFLLYELRFNIRHHLTM